jgi:hypothetical protein
MIRDRSARDRSLLKQPREVVKRIVRIRVIRKCREIALAIARRRSRWASASSEKKRSKALRDTLETCGREALRARRNGLEALEAIYNLALYFLVAERDIQTFKVDALTHHDAWTRSLCARVILLTIYELEVDKAAGNRLRQAMEVTDVPAELRNKVAQALRTIRAAQQRAQKQFANLRHSTIAHRDADAVTQYRRISELDSLSILQTAAEFYNGTHELMDVIPELLKHVAGTRGLLAQLIVQARRSKE